MKLTKIITFLLTIGILLCSCTCKDDRETETEKSYIESWSPEIISSDPYNVQYLASFDSVKSLYRTIKSSPDQYNNKKIKVFGTVFNYSSIKLVDITDLSKIKDIDKSSLHSNNLGVAERNMFDSQTGHEIELNIKSDAQYAVISTGDLVKLYGTLRIERNKIYIDDCTYSLVATLEERIEKFK